MSTKVYLHEYKNHSCDPVNVRWAVLADGPWKGWLEAKCSECGLLSRIKAEELVESTAELRGGCLLPEEWDAVGEALKKAGREDLLTRLRDHDHTLGQVYLKTAAMLDQVVRNGGRWPT